MRSREPRLSVCTLSGSPLARTGRILAQFRELASEIVCAVDARTPEAELASVRSVADCVLRCELDASSSSERNLAWLYSQCSGDWILRIDGDEVPSAKLLGLLPALLADHDVVQYVLPRRWLWPDPAHYLNEHLWSDDWLPRLIRNHPPLLRFPGLMHTDVEWAPQRRYVDACLYHLDCLVNPLAKRRAKVAVYERRRPGHVSERGFPVNDIYLPEDAAQHPVATTPAEDLPTLEAVLAQTAVLTDGGARPVPVVPLEVTDKLWAQRPIPPSAYAARIEVIDPPERLVPGELRHVWAQFHNDGDETWPWGDFDPKIRPATRWFRDDGVTLYEDSLRTLLTTDCRAGMSTLQPVLIRAPNVPGRFRLEFNLVHESVRWFDAGVTFPVLVTDGSLDATEPG